MALVHFVSRRHAEQPLCGQRADPPWIESSRTDTVTCPGCCSRLAGMRRDEQPPEGAADGP